MRVKPAYLADLAISPIPAAQFNCITIHKSQCVLDYPSSGADTWLVSIAMFEARRQVPLE